MPVPACRQPESPEPPPDASRPRQRRCAYWTSKAGPPLMSPHQGGLNATPQADPAVTSHNFKLCEELMKNIGIHNVARGPYAPLANGALLPVYF